MTPHVAKRVDVTQPNFSPLKKRYDFHNYTLEGREAVRADEEPNCDLDHDPSPMPAPSPPLETNSDSKVSGVTN